MIISDVIHLSYSNYMKLYQVFYFFFDLLTEVKEKVKHVFHFS